MKQVFGAYGIQASLETRLVRFEKKEFTPETFSRLAVL